MRDVKRDFSSTAERGRWTAKRFGGGVERPRDREKSLGIVFTFSSFAGVDTPDPLRAVAHLPRSSVSFGNARVEERQTQAWS